MLGTNPPHVQLTLNSNSYSGGEGSPHIAIWDLVGRALKQPVCRLLGGVMSPEVPAYATGLYYTKGDQATLLKASKGKLLINMIIPLWSARKTIVSGPSTW